MSFKPSLAVAFAAKKGLEMRHFLGEKGNPQAIKKAKQLLKRQNVSINTVKKMYDRLTKPRKKCIKDATEFYLNGGDAGRRWAKRILRQEGYL